MSPRPVNSIYRILYLTRQQSHRPVASQGNQTRRVPGLHGVNQLVHFVLDAGGDRDGVLYHSTGSDALDVVLIEASGADASGAVDGAIVSARALSAPGEVSDVCERLRRDAAEDLDDEGNDSISAITFDT